MNDLPSPLDKTFANKKDLQAFFSNLIIDITKLLNCDRSYLYLRDPELFLGQIIHCYCAEPNIPNLAQKKSRTEPYYITNRDLLFAAALAGESNIFIDTIQQLVLQERQANTGDFWQTNYAEHHALIQGHIFIEQKLWGIIRVAQFKHHRPWSRFDRDLINLIIDRITPLATVYVKKELSHTLQHYNDRNAKTLVRDRIEH